MKITIKLGGIVAAILSWTTWHSIGWAIVHMLCGWLYVIYWAFTNVIYWALSGGQ